MVESDGSILLDGGPTWEEARQLVGRSSPASSHRKPDAATARTALLVRLLPHPRPPPLPRDPSHTFRAVPAPTRNRCAAPCERDDVSAHLHVESWFRWLEDEEFNVGNPAARLRRPTRHPTPQPWLDRNQLTDLLAAAEDEGGDVYAMTCLLALNGLRVSEACNVNVTDLAGSRYQPTLRILGKGDKPAEVVLNPRTWQAIDQVVHGRSEGPLLRNRWGNRIRRHNIASILVRLAKTAGIRVHVTPHALRRSYLTIGLQQGVPLCEMQRAARHTKADTTIAYDQSVRSFHRDPTFVLMSATAR